VTGPDVQAEYLRQRRNLRRRQLYRARRDGAREASVFIQRQAQRYVEHATRLDRADAALCGWRERADAALGDWRARMDAQAVEAAWSA